MNNLPEGFLENRLQELMADDDLDALRSSVMPPRQQGQAGQAGNFDQPSAMRRPVNFDQPSAVRRPVSFDQPSAQRGAPPRPPQADLPLLNHPTLGNFDQPSGRRVPNAAPLNFNQPARPPQRPAQPQGNSAGNPPGNLDQMRQPNQVRPNFDQTSGTNPNRRVNFDTPSRRQPQVPATQRMPQGQGSRGMENRGMDWSSSLLNSISSYDEKTQPDTAELLQGALEALTDAVIITDCNGRLTWVNRYASELLDMPATTLMGTPATAVFGKYAAAFVPAELLLLAPHGRLNDWQINLLLPSAVRRLMVFNFALTRRNGEQVVVAIGHEYREPAANPPHVGAQPGAVTQPPAYVAERITVRLRPEAEAALPLSAFAPIVAVPNRPVSAPIVAVPNANELEPLPQAAVPAQAPAAPPVKLAPIANPVAPPPPAPAIAAPALPPLAIEAAPVMPPVMLEPVAAPVIEQARNAAIPELVTLTLAPVPQVLPVEVAPAPITPEPIALAIPAPVAPPPAPVSATMPAIMAEPVIPAAPPSLPPQVLVNEVLVNEAAPVIAANVSAEISTPTQVSEAEPAEAAAAQFWQFLEYAPEPMMVTDQRGRIVQLNGLAEELFGYDRAEMLGEKALALLAKQSRNSQLPRFPFGITEASLNGISEIVEVHGWHRDGAEFPLEMTRRQTDNGQYVVLTLRPVAPRPSEALAETLAEALPEVLPEAAPVTPIAVTPIAVTPIAFTPIEGFIPVTPTTPPAFAVPDFAVNDSASANGNTSSTPSLMLTFNEHLRRHNRALGELSRSSAWQKQGLTAALSEITAVAAQALDTARVSLWLFNEARTEIICQDLFEAVDERHSHGLTLSAEDFPRYFAAMFADRTITAHDAHTDERTAEFSASYLTPNNITSMLDAPIRALGRQIGVVCLEHIGAPRVWSPEDETFAASVADFVAMAYEAEERQAAQASQARLAAVLQATPDCVSITNGCGHLTFLNEAGRRLVERAQGEDISDLVIADLYSPPAYAQMENVILPAALTHGLWTGETTLRRADGSEMPVAQVTFAQKDEQGQLEFVAHIHHDLTARKQMEEERSALLEHEKQLRRSAEEHIQHKDDFLSTLSHELRTPLTGIIGWLELIRSGTLNDEELERGLVTIERDAQTQMKLVNDLLDASRVISDKLTLDARPLELMNVVAAALDTVRPQIEEKNIKLNISFQPWVGPFVGDGSRLQQVVWNLLANAVKFTPSGGVIEVALARNQSQALIIVRDNGVGITPEFLPHLFERFRQQDGSTVRHHGGLGLGLAIAKHIVELHHGTITAYSAGLNQGAEVVVTLPLAASQAAAAPKATGLAEKLQKPMQQRQPLLAGIRVLAVDDQPGARDLFRTVLAQYQAEVHLAASAAEARQLLATWLPHILVSDLGMPGEDGCEMIRHIRALAPELGGRIPAIALTAYASEQDRLRALQAGFNLHLSKPINPAELAAAVIQLVKPDQPAPALLSTSGSLRESISMIETAA